MDNLRLGVEWDISEDTLNASMANAKKELSGVGQTVEDVQKKVNESLSSIGNGASEQSFSRTAEKQAGILRQVGAEYRNTLANALNAFSGMEGGAQRNYDILARLDVELKGVAAAQSHLSERFQKGLVTQRDYLQGAKALAVQENEVKARIAEVNKTIAQNTAVEREAIGSISQKTARLTQLEQQYRKLSAAQREHEQVGGKIREEYRKLKDEVDKLNQSLSGTASGGIGKAFGTLRDIAAVAGIAFGAQQLMNFGKELFNIAKEAEGVRGAFSHIGDESTLQSLRNGVKGTVSDLELMKLAVRADAFKIPMDVLSTGLEFARKRAVALGKDVDYMVNSFVDGLGRKSTLVLDNLGISAIELQEEIKKTGDFAKAVSVIMERDLAKGGFAIDTLADKTARWSAMWDNMKLKISDVLGNIADTLTGNITIDQNYVASESSSRRQANDLSNVVYVERVKRIQEAQSELDKLALKYQALKAIENPDQETKLRTAALQMEYTIQNNVLNSMKEQNKAMNEAARIQEGIVSNEELRQQIEDKRSQANSWIVRDDSDRKYVAKLFAEADALQKQLDERQGKTAKKASTDRTKILEQETKERERILASWAALDADYAAKNLSKDEQEVQAVRDKYAKIRKEIEDFNKKTKGQRISLDGLSASEDAAVKATRYRQETDALVKELEKRKSAWEEYTAAVSKIGTENANAMYGGTAPADYGTSLQGEISGLQGKYSLTNVEKQRLDALLKIQVDHNAEMAKKRRDDYQNAIEASQTNSDNIKRIQEQLWKDIAALGDNSDPARVEKLKKAARDKIAAEYEAAIKTETKWDEVFATIGTMSKKAADEWITSAERAAATALNNGEITKAQYLQMLQELQDKYKEVSGSNDPFRNLFESIKKYKGDVSSFGKDSITATMSFRDMAGAASNALAGVSDVIGTVADSFDTLGIGNEDLQETLGKVQNLVGGLSELGQGIASGNPVTMITGGIKTLTSVIDLFNTKDKKLQKQIDGYMKAIKALEVQYDQLQRKINDSVGESYYDDSALAVKNLQQQIVKLQQARDAESKKKKSDADAIENYNDQIRQAQAAIEDLNKAISQQLLQTDFKQLSQSISDALLSAFEAGEDGIVSMEKVFDQFIKNALANSLKLKMIEPLMKQMTDDLTSYMLNNDNSLVGFNFDGWRAQLDAAAKQFNEGLASAYEGLGLQKESTSSSGTSGMAGLISKAITEDSANKWMGVQLNIHTLTKQGVVIATDSLAVQKQQLASVLTMVRHQAAIEHNTAMTVERLDIAVGHLANIVRNTGGKTARDLG